MPCRWSCLVLDQKLHSLCSLWLLACELSFLSFVNPWDMWSHVKNWTVISGGCHQSRWNFHGFSCARNWFAFLWYHYVNLSNMLFGHARQCHVTTLLVMRNTNGLNQRVEIEQLFQGWRRHDCGYKCEASLPTPGVGSWKGHTWANTANPPIMVAFKLMGWYQFPVCGLWPAGQHCTSLNISGCLNCRLNSPMSMIWAIGETWCFCFIRGFASDGIGGHVAGVQAKGAIVFSLYSESNVPLCMWSKEKQMSSGYPGLEIMHKCRYGTSFTSLKGTKVHSTATSKLIPRCTKLQVTTQSWLFIVYMSKALFIVWSNNCTNVRIFKPWRIHHPAKSRVWQLTFKIYPGTRLDHHSSHFFEAWQVFEAPGRSTIQWSPELDIQPSRSTLAQDWTITVAIFLRLDRFLKPLAGPPSSEVQSWTANLQDLPWRKTGPSQ